MRTEQRYPIRRRIMVGLGGILGLGLLTHAQQTGRPDLLLIGGVRSHRRDRADAAPGGPDPTRRHSACQCFAEPAAYAGSWDADPPGLDTPVPVDGIDRRPAIRRSAPFVIADATDDLAVLCSAQPVEHGSLACNPLIAMGQPIGVIHMESAEPIGDATITSAIRIAEQVAVAVANARLMKTMESLAMTDGLTGLRNARFFDTYLEQELAAAERDRMDLSILMIDIDHFKKFNDTYGHPGGDEALRVFGRAVRGVIRGSDLAARYGGEEFVIPLRHTDLEGAAIVAEKLRVAVAAAVVDLGPSRYGRFTISTGVATAGPEHLDQKSLMSSADAALYRAKSNGRNQVVTSSLTLESASTAGFSEAADASDVLPQTSGNVVAIGRRRHRGTRLQTGQSEQAATPI